MRIRRELRAKDDGYRNPLVPGLHASSDALRLSEEIAFSSARLLALQQRPPGLYAEIRTLADEGETGRATWMCFLTVYLSPLQGEEPFAGVRLALAQGQAPTLQGIPLGPRTSYDPARATETLLAFRQWAAGAGRSGEGRHGDAFLGEESWTPQRRFERVFERLAFPGFGRMGRYELLVTLGHLGVYALKADSLHLADGRGGAPDLTTLAAKRIFGIGESIYLERRALQFAEELSVPIEALDLAFANWSEPQRATLGFAADLLDNDARERAQKVLGL